MRQCLASVYDSIGRCNGKCDYEVLIANDASTDGSLSICNEFAGRDEGRFHVFTHEENLWSAEARNTLLRHVSGDYVAWVDADDEVECEWLSAIVDGIERFAPDIVAYDYTECRGSVQKVNAYGVRILGIQQGAVDMTNPRKCILDIIYGINGALSYLWPKVFKRQLFDRLCFDTPRYVFEDMMMWNKLAPRIQTVAYIAKPLYKYRINESGETCNRPFEYQVMDIDCLLQQATTVAQPWKKAIEYRAAAKMRTVIRDYGEGRSGMKIAKVKIFEYKQFIRDHWLSILLDVHLNARKKLGALLYSI